MLLTVRVLAKSGSSVGRRPIMWPGNVVSSGARITCTQLVTIMHL